VKPLKNVAASVSQRLLNIARQTNRPFNELVQYYALERWLYRLARSDYRNRFVLKGALMLLVWKTPVTRPTRDIDLLGRMSNDLESIRGFAADVSKTPVEDDGIVFDPSSVAVERIAEDAEYEGVRAKFQGRLGNTRLPMQIDIGFSDIVTPEPVTISYPTILDLPAPELHAYNRETAIAEKFQAMVKLGELNSRMKDFFDIMALTTTGEFEGSLVANAIRETFARRETAIEAEPVCFTKEFAEDAAKQTQWNAFVRRSLLAHVPSNFSEVVGQVRQFLQPVAVSLALGRTFDLRWHAAGPWR
jgi:predicted nucleotidyltransferase component of viral defense system